MRLKFLGSGDAFGSGGRFNTCFLVDRGHSRFLIDCGASSMVAIRHFDVDPNSIDAIVLSHLHGDHYGGLPYFILDGQFASRRTKPLVIAGPVGLRQRLDVLMEACYPNSTNAEREFKIEVVEIETRKPTPIGPVAGLTVTAFEVVHPSGTPSLALRLESDGKTITYSGDTEWTDTLIEAGRNADLYIGECYTYDRKMRFHTDYLTLAPKLPLITAKRVVLTHMSPPMLARTAEMKGCEAAYDGLEIEIG